jgi:hypothetical protein
MTRMEAMSCFSNLCDDLLGQRLERAGQDDALLGVDRVLDEDERADVLQVERLGDLEVLDLVEEVEDVDVARVADPSARKSVVIRNLRRRRRRSR